MSDTNSHIESILSGIPGWIRGLAIIFAYVGFPAFVSLFFLLQSVGWVPEPVQARILAETKEHSTQMQLIAEDIKEHRAAQERLLERVSVGLRIICQNEAKTQAERNNCENIK